MEVMEDTEIYKGFIVYRDVFTKLYYIQYSEYYESEPYMSKEHAKHDIDVYGCA